MLANRLRIKSGITLQTTAISLNSGYRAIPDPIAVTDLKQWGFAPAYGGYPVIGSVNPDNVSGFLIEELVESLQYASEDATWTNPIERGFQITLVTPGYTLLQSAFTTITTPGGSFSTASASYFSNAGGKANWGWTTGNPAGASPEFLSTGTVTVTV